jgi:hypothetical protein
MKTLASKIARELTKASHCGVYQPDLSRVWPHNGVRRENLVAEFGKQHGWRVRFYKDGFCAIFDKDIRKMKNLVPFVGVSLSHALTCLQPS